MLEQFGATVERKENGVKVSGGQLKGITVDAAQTPDLVCALVAAAASAQGVTQIEHAERLRMKESDRIDTLSQMLDHMGVQVRQHPDGMTIQGTCVRGGKVCAFGDHRIAMAATILSQNCRQPVAIDQAQSVNKSYPGFFKDFELLGGEVMLDKRRGRV